MVNSNYSNHTNHIDQITFCSYNVKNYDIIKYDAVKALFNDAVKALFKKNDFP